jgi:hypothetical protein
MSMGAVYEWKDMCMRIGLGAEKQIKNIWNGERSNSANAYREGHHDDGTRLLLI